MEKRLSAKFSALIRTAITPAEKTNPTSFSETQLAIFVDGCFWHGCPKHGTNPKANAAFWLAKITGNQARDRRVNRLLRAKGWRVLRIWEHELKHRNEHRLLARLTRALA